MSTRPKAPPWDQEPGADTWALGEEVEAVHAAVRDTGGTLVKLSLEGEMLVASFFVPDEFDAVLGVFKVAKVRQVAEKFSGVWQALAAARLNKWRTKRAAQGKADNGVIRWLARMTKADSHGKLPEGTSRVDDDAETTVEAKGTEGNVGPGTFGPEDFALGRNPGIVDFAGDAQHGFKIPTPNGLAQAIEDECAATVERSGRIRFSLKDVDFFKVFDPAHEQAGWWTGRELRYVWYNYRGHVDFYDGNGNLWFPPEGWTPPVQWGPPWWYY